MNNEWHKSGVKKERVKKKYLCDKEIFVHKQLTF